MKTVPAICLVVLVAATGRSAENPATLADLDHALAAGDFAALDAAVKAVQPVAAGGPALGIIWTGLKGNDPAVRRRSAYALSQVDPEAAKQAIPRIVEALRDNDPRIRARVALALGQMGATAREAIPTLAELLKDQDPHVRAGTIRALDSIRAAEAKATVPLLVALLKDPVPPVRGMTAAVLGQLGAAAHEAIPALQAVQATDVEPDVRAEAASALEEIAPPVHLLVDALDSPDAKRRLWAVSVLIDPGSAGRGYCPALLAEVLRHDARASVRGWGGVCPGQGRRPGPQCLPRACRGAPGPGSARADGGVSLGPGPARPRALAQGRTGPRPRRLQGRGRRRGRVRGHRPGQPRPGR